MQKLTVAEIPLFLEASSGLICRFPKLRIAEIPKFPNPKVTRGVEIFETFTNHENFVQGLRSE